MWSRQSAGSCRCSTKKESCSTTSGRGEPASASFSCPLVCGLITTTGFWLWTPTIGGFRSFITTLWEKRREQERNLEVKDHRGTSGGALERFDPGADQCGCTGGAQHVAGFGSAGDRHAERALHVLSCSPFRHQRERRSSTDSAVEPEAFECAGLPDVQQLDDGESGQLFTPARLKQYALFELS